MQVYALSVAQWNDIVWYWYCRGREYGGKREVHSIRSLCLAGHFQAILATGVNRHMVRGAVCGMRHRRIAGHTSPARRTGEADRRQIHFSFFNQKGALLLGPSIAGLTGYNGVGWYKYLRQGIFFFFAFSARTPEVMRRVKKFVMLLLIWYVVELLLAFHGREVVNLNDRIGGANMK